MTKGNLLNNAWFLKEQIEVLEKEYESVISQLEAVAREEGVLEKDNRILENAELRFCLSTSFKTNDNAVKLFKDKGLEEFIKIKESVFIGDLKKVCSEEEIIKQQYATKFYTKKLTKKEKINE
jgi:hypothetical protein